MNCLPEKKKLLYFENDVVDLFVYPSWLND